MAYISHVFCFIRPRFSTLHVVRSNSSTPGNSEHTDNSKTSQDMSTDPASTATNSEPYGWDFVREYTKKSLAADSGDEKAFARIRRTLKAKLDETRRQDNMVRASNSPSNNNNNNSGRSRSGDFARARRRSPFHFQDRRRDQDDRRTLRTYQDGQRTTSHHRETRTDFRRDRYDRYCYTCNRRGHLSFDCPEQ
jgi:hypothetical protein